MAADILYPSIQPLRPASFERVNVLTRLISSLVKQHFVVDIIAAIPVCLFAEYLVFGRTGLNRWIVGKRFPFIIQPVLCPDTEDREGASV